MSPRRRRSQQLKQSRETPPPRRYPKYKILNFDRLDYCSCLANLEEVASLPNYKFVKGDICSADLVNYVLETEKIDTIMHFAAQTHVDNSFGNSFQFTQNNIYGTHVLLESAKCAGVKRFVHVSTDEVYGEGEHDESPMIEDHVLEPTNPYAATKAAAENIVKSYWSSFKLPVIITRGNNVYGPHQYPEKVIPKFIRRLVNGEPCCIHGDGSNSRHYIYVGDVVSAFDTVLHKGVPGETYNIGCHEEITNLQLAERLVREIYPACKDAREKIDFVEDRAFNDVRYYLNYEKLLGLDWKPVVSFEEGLRKTIEWYKTVDTKWWDVGTDSSLAPHPTPAEVVSASASAAK